MNSSQNEELLVSKRVIYLKRFAKIAGACLLSIVAIKGCSFVEHHFITQDIDRYAGWSDEIKKGYFVKTFPSREEIEEYLFDTTIVTSDTPIGNNVTYFDRHGSFFEWHGTLPRIIRGRWFLVPMLDKIVYAGEWRIAIIYSFCRELDDGSFTEDNCFLISDKQQVRSFRRGAQEYRTGDIFDLSRRERAPFGLTAPINIEQLRARISR